MIQRLRDRFWLWRIGAKREPLPSEINPNATIVSVSIDLDRKQLQRLRQLIEREKI